MIGNLAQKHWLGISIGLGAVILIAVFLAPVIASARDLSKGGRILDEIISGTNLKSDASVCLEHTSGQEADPEQAEKAHAHLQSAHDRRPGSTYPLYLLGKLACLKGDYLSAIAHFDAFIESRPDNPLGYLDRSFARESLCAMSPSGTFQLPEPLGGHQVCRDAISIDLMLDDWDAAAVLGKHFLDRGRFAASQGDRVEALAWYARAAIHSPDAGAPWVQAGELFFEAGDWMAASQAYSIAEALLVENRDMPYRLGYSWYELGSYQDAVSAFSRAAERKNGKIGESNVFYMWGMALLALPEDETNHLDALKAFTDAIERDDYSEEQWKRADAYYRRAFLYNREKETDRAFADLDQALTLNPEHYWSHVLMARMYRNLGDIELSLSYAYKAVDLRPEAVGAYRFLGDYFLETGQQESAVEVYRAILEIDPEDEEALEAIQSLVP